jgi:hypothetical protein
MVAIGPFRQIAALHHFGRKRGAADMEGGPGVTDCDINDPLPTLDLAGRHVPDRLQPRDVIRRDLLERAKTPAVIGPAEVAETSLIIPQQK